MKKMLLLLTTALLILPGLTAQPLMERLQEFADAQRPSAVSIAIIKDGQVTYHHFGRLSKADRSPPSEHTLYEIGALSSVFTTTLMLRLAEEGRYNPEREIAFYLPDSLSPPRFQPQRCAEVVLPGTPVRRIMSCSNDHSRASVCITGCDLASHVSGLPNSGLGLYDWHPIGKAAFLTGPATGLRSAELLQKLGEATFKSEPGHSYHFSNAGIALLGMAMESATNQRYEDLLHQHILRPLGLQDTKVDISAEQRTRLAEGHNDRGRRTDSWHFKTLAPAAGLKSTTADLTDILNAYLNPEKNWENTMLEGQQARADVSFPTLEYSTQAAYGWLVSYLPEPHPRLAVWMNGGTAGYSAFAGFVKDEQIGVVVLTAQAGAEATQLGMDLLKILD
ncbi:serine hydrolase domain-containing protein [Phaeodactylibacter xiamenensis]|uniref:serine hydrolase domain-containing protein n=1 Tax=Phaeodactylibacter xiamenensis TaxID=1524460 RepID=UPI003CCB79FC